MGRRAGDTASHSDFPNSLQKYPTVQFMPQKLIFYFHQMSRVKGAAVMGFQWRGGGEPRGMIVEAKEQTSPQAPSRPRGQGLKQVWVPSRPRLPSLLLPSPALRALPRNRSVPSCL